MSHNVTERSWLSLGRAFLEGCQDIWSCIWRRFGLVLHDYCKIRAAVLQVSHLYSSMSCNLFNLCSFLDCSRKKRFPWQHRYFLITNGSLFFPQLGGYTVMSFGSVLLIMHLIMSLVTNYAMVLRGQDGATRLVFDSPFMMSSTLSPRHGQISSLAVGSFPHACKPRPVHVASCAGMHVLCVIDRVFSCSILCGLQHRKPPQMDSEVVKKTAETAVLEINNFLRWYWSLLSAANLMSALQVRLSCTFFSVQN